VLPVELYHRAPTQNCVDSMPSASVVLPPSPTRPLRRQTTSSVQVQEVLTEELVRERKKVRDLQLQLHENQTLFTEVMAEARDIILASVRDDDSIDDDSPAMPSAGAPVGRKGPVPHTSSGRDGVDESRALSSREIGGTDAEGWSGIGGAGSSQATGRRVGDEGVRGGEAQTSDNAASRPNLDIKEWICSWRNRGTSDGCSAALSDFDRGDVTGATNATAAREPGDLVIASGRGGAMDALVHAPGLNGNCIVARPALGAVAMATNVAGTGGGAESGRGVDVAVVEAAGAMLEAQAVVELGGLGANMHDSMDVEQLTSDAEDLLSVRPSPPPPCFCMYPAELACWRSSNGADGWC
jgi:hypothetical protein